MAYHAEWIEIVHGWDYFDSLSIFNNSIKTTSYFYLSPTFRKVY